MRADEADGWPRPVHEQVGRATFAGQCDRPITIEVDFQWGSDAVRPSREDEQSAPLVNGMPKCLGVVCPTVANGPEISDIAHI
jgi:hypothetical protein